jgi:hypothetical protein
MFRHYLTYQMALGFESVCRTTGNPELLRCAQAMLHHLSLALHRRDPKEVSKSFYVTLTYLRDCQELLDREHIDAFEVRGKWEVLNARLEQLCLDACSVEKGQLRMLG